MSTHNKPVFANGVGPALETKINKTIAISYFAVTSSIIFWVKGIIVSGHIYYTKLILYSRYRSKEIIKDTFSKIKE